MSDEILGQFKQPVQKENKTDKKRKLKIGFIGTGSIARHHISAYSAMDDVEVVAACDIIPGKAEKFMQDHEIEGVRYYTSCEEMFEKEQLDGVSNCTYNTSHMATTICALKHHVPVLLEKPLSVTLEEAEAICKAEKESGTFVSVGFQPRYNDNMKMIKKIVESGALGKIYYIPTGGGRRRGIPVRTFIEKSTGGIGAMADIGCYSLDMVLNALGYPKPVTVTGYTSDYFGKNPKYNGDDASRFSVEDFAAGFIRLEGGIILDFRIAWAMHPDTPGDTIIFGTEGALRIPSTHSWNGTIGGPMTIYHDVCGVPTETVIPEIESGGQGGFFRKKVRAFVDAIRTNGPAPIPTSQIIINQAIIDGIVKSAECGHEVEVKIAEI